MEQIANYIINNGVAVGVLIYFIFRDWKFMGTLTETLALLKQGQETTNKCLKALSDKKKEEDDLC